MFKKFLILVFMSLSFSKPAISAEDNAYRFSFTDIKGKELNLSDYKGKLIMIVNTACLCGFTPQFAKLEKLYEKYKDKDFILIGVPSDNFGGQELDSEKDVEEYTQKNFKITFPLTSITDVKGDKAHPFYKWAATKVSILGTPKWNFHKYLIDKNGNLVEWYASTTSPTSKKITHKIDKLLK